MALSRVFLIINSLSGSELYLAEWLIWPPASAINFYYVPLRFRMLFDGSVSFLFDVLQSHVVFSELPPVEGEEEEVRVTEMTS